MVIKKMILIIFLITSFVISGLSSLRVQVQGDLTNKSISSFQVENNGEIIGVFFDTNTPQIDFGANEIIQALEKQNFKV